ncbi:hypothetical protein N0V93_009513 [Gnomoniopsis smithogilvyi]|uniref:Uncharacterized protein n=1 Tax=Gnomoniopsis smithogilvyi TaxID=1191159 RepID=A0A9W8YMY9_9PEZI|nr:hypothetical protein N0V93_009513 [Gnomoniopsis smithogilvyi]
MGFIAMFSLGLITVAMTAVRFVEMHEDANTIGERAPASLYWCNIIRLLAYVYSPISSFLSDLARPKPTPSNMQNSRKAQYRCASSNQASSTRLD